MSSGLYNEGLFREGLLRTTNLVRPGLITQFDTLEEALTRFAVNGVEAALALDFIGSEYRTANTSTTFADAFTGTSPKLTYSTAAGSNSTMVNSSGNLVWAPHNLLRYSEDFSSPQWTKTNVSLLDDQEASPDGLGLTQHVVFPSGGGSDRLRYAAFAHTVGAKYTFRFWVKAVSGTASGTLDQGNLTSQAFTATSSWQPVTHSVTFSANNWWDIELSGPGTIAIWGAHIYRSDLGGMAQVPQSATGFETYVPTNGAAEYLPRVGHHVYNGSTWVNEGLLIESEPRTNLIQHSEDFSQWSSTTLEPLQTGFTSPDGASNGTKIIPTTASTAHYVSSGGVTVTNGATYTFSFFAKKPDTDGYRYANTWASAWTDKTGQGPIFDLQTGLVENANGLECNMEDYGQGWYRCVVTGSVNNTSLDPRIYPANASTALPYAGDGTSGIIIYGAQLEQGATPSSYIPTNGSTVIRGGQSLVVPPAEFGWPEPEYIGPELVTNDDFSSGLTGWNDTAVTNSGGTVSVSVEGEVTVTRGTSRAEFYQVITTEIGKVYGFNGSVVEKQGTGNASIWIGSTRNNASALNISNAPVGLASGQFVAEDTSLYVTLVVNGQEGDAITFDNISVREINPLSVSIQMDGRITYADDDVDTANPSLAYWDAGSNNYIHVKNNTYGAPITGRFDATQDNGTGSAKASVSGNTLFAPGVLVPFNIASRHGSTFINGAADGTALTADTTPTALPDLSNTDLEIAQDYMGTIGQFRQFAGDVGDTGLVTATNPSTEPTLSLTFDGTEGSFYNLSWSE